MTNKNKDTSPKRRIAKKKRMSPVKKPNKRELSIPVRYYEKLHRPPRDKLLQDKLADRLVLWAKTDEALTIDGFALKELISPYRFKRMAPENEYFQQALEYARAAVGDRLFKLGLFKKADSSLVAKTLPIYNEEYREFVLQKQDKQQQGIINVIMERFPSSSEVPEIPEEDE